MNAYRIVDWNRFYENDRSRNTKNCRWCAIPNKQDGLGYSRLLGMPDGPALYGCFVAIVLMASKQESRSGWLTRDGSPPTHGEVTADSRPTPSSLPLSPSDIGLMIRMPEALVLATIEACCSEAIGWLEVTADSRPTHSERKKEEKGIEEKAPPTPKGVPAAPGGVDSLKQATKNGFVTPSVIDVRIKCLEIDLPVKEAEAFVDFYQSNGWKVGKNPMKDWVCALQGWKRRRDEKAAQSKGHQGQIRNNHVSGNL